MIQLALCLLLEDYSWFFFFFICVCAGRTHQGWWEKLRLQSLMKSWALRCNMWKKKHKTFIRRRNQNMWQFIELSGFVWGPREQDLWILLLFYAKRETLAECSVLSKPEGKFGAVRMNLMSVCTLLPVRCVHAGFVTLHRISSLSHLSPTTAATRPWLVLPGVLDLTHEASFAVLCIIYHHWNIFNYTDRLNTNFARQITKFSFLSQGGWRERSQARLGTGICTACFHSS